MYRVAFLCWGCLSHREEEAVVDDLVVMYQRVYVALYRLENVVAFEGLNGTPKMTVASVCSIPTVTFWG